MTADRHGDYFSGPNWWHAASSVLPLMMSRYETRRACGKHWQAYIPIVNLKDRDVECLSNVCRKVRMFGSTEKVQVLNPQLEWPVAVPPSLRKSSNLTRLRSSPLIPVSRNSLRLIPKTTHGARFISLFAVSAALPGPANPSFINSEAAESLQRSLD